MAQLLSPVSAEALFKYRSLYSSLRCSGYGLRGSAGNRRSGINRRLFNRGHRRRIDPIAAVGKESFSKEELVDDYYAVLGLLPDASPKQIKKAYYNCMKACHPDLSGDDPGVTNFCMFINEVYAVLSDPVQRMIYDEINGYALTTFNPFFDDTAPKDHAFVDEFSCIGCKNCANVASDVFRIEEDFGRARVFCQSGNPALVQEAIDSCPVDCIHWTSAAQLSLLEDEMHRMERVNVGLMLSGMGGASPDVFAMCLGRLDRQLRSFVLLRYAFYIVCSWVGGHFYFRTVPNLDIAKRRWERLQSKVLEKAKLRMMKQKDSDISWIWSNLWGNSKGYRNTEEDVKERAKKAAAASKRWSQYSSRGVDQSPTLNLPEMTSKSE